LSPSRKPGKGILGIRGKITKGMRSLRSEGRQINEEGRGISFRKKCAGPVHKMTSPNRGSVGQREEECGAETSSELLKVGGLTMY